MIRQSIYFLLFQINLSKINAYLDLFQINEFKNLLNVLWCGFDKTANLCAVAREVISDNGFSVAGVCYLCTLQLVIE